VETYLLTGGPDQASRIALRIIEVFREGRERGREADTSRLLGAIALPSYPPDLGTAEARYRDALRLATELEMRPLIAHCHFGLGQVYARAADRGRACEHLDTATTMFRQMDMQFWLEKVEAQARELA
jgi:hypothetical protein